MVHRLRRLVSRILLPPYHSSATIWAVFVLLVVLVVIIVPEFAYPLNLFNVLVQLVPLGLASLGQHFVIIGGGIDLSIGSQISLITIVLSSTAGTGAAAIVAAIALCLVLGVLFGTINGLLVHYVRIPPLVVTLCTGYIFQGIAFAFHQTTGGFIPAGLHAVLTAAWGPFSVPLLLYVVFVLMGFFVLCHSPYGRHLYALGASEDVLDSSGVRVVSVRVASYAAGGLMAAVTGLYLAVRLKSGGAHYGTAFTLTSISSVVVGGTSIAGGEGSMFGTVAGALIVSMLNNVLNNISFRYGFQSSFYKDVMTGLILIGAMLFYRKRR